MPRTHTITTYQIDELSPESQAKALDNCREINVDDDDWYETTIETVAEVADMLGIDTRVQRVQLANRNERLAPAIYFSGFGYQGSGACFEGSYSHAEGALAAVTEELPEATEVHSVARRLEAVQLENARQVSASVRHEGRYSHEGCTEIEVYREDDDELLTEGAEAEVASALRAFMRWIYQVVEQEHESLQSDEVVRDSIVANEVEFLENGNIYTGP